MMKNIIYLVLAMIILSSCSENESKTTNTYLSEVLTELNKIESASYPSTREAWDPGDTIANFIQRFHITEYNNPLDTFIGASYVFLNEKDRILRWVYDGHMIATTYHNEKGVLIDSFKVRKLPFRPTTPPFYNRTKNIVKYALETKDSITLERENLEGVVYLKLIIHEDRQVEFFGKAHYMPKSPYNYGDPTSIYELWIDKSTNLPFKFRREMSHSISVQSVSNPEFNKLKIENFKASDYFPKDYKIQQKGQGSKKVNPNKLLGKKAADWQLTNADGKDISLSDFKSKVMMIQFTSVSCGPCRGSIPFLKQLASEYKKEDFEFVAIESTSRNLNVLKRYMTRNRFNYPFLLSTKEVVKNYSIKSYPIFFFLDENRIIRKVITGYGTTSDKKIRKAIDELI